VLAQREAAARGGGGGGGGGGNEGGDEGDDDIETAKGMARLFAEIGEAYTALIATGASHMPQCLTPLFVIASKDGYPSSLTCYTMSRSEHDHVLLPVC